MSAPKKTSKPPAFAPVSDMDAIMANRAVQLAAAGKPHEAIPLIRQFIANNPNDARGHFNLGNMLRALGDNAAALEAYRRAVKLAPTFAPAQLNLANTLRDLGRRDDAYAAYRKTMQVDASAWAAIAEVANIQADRGEWGGLAELEARTLAGMRQSRDVPPFILLAMDASAEDQLQAGRNWGGQFPQSRQPRPAWSLRPGERLRIGYVSNDFRKHATAMLMAELVERHDRDRFEIFGYSHGPDDGSALRARMVAGFDHFVDLRAMSDHDAAQRILADGIHILVDLKGYTNGARTGIFTRLPAPVLVNYLGYPGTMGIAAYDYIVADATVIPPEHEGYYSERVVRLPHCYQPNDTKRAIAAPPARAECGLPDGAFVFCCFNQSVKIRAEQFALWMDILRAVPGSVLWLLDNPANANLRKAARRHGIDPARLVFARYAEPDRHLARHCHADLFLDTLPCNAHTTASDALWAGLPVLTQLGGTFAGRVAASLVRAVGLPELVVDSAEDYRALAIALATSDRGRLDALRRRLADQRNSAPLFDIARYTRDLEAAYVAMADCAAAQAADTQP